MFKPHCNIDKTDRINRIVIGIILIAATLLGVSWIFYLIVGFALIIEGMVGWCSIPYLRDKIKRYWH